MRQLLQDIDHLLRGRFTSRENLLAGKISVPVGTLVRAGLLLGVAYGLCMGLFAVLRPDNSSYAQLFATAVKVPCLFLLTLVVTFPSLYVFSALANSRLRHIDTLRLMLAAIGVNLALLASLGPVTGFFTLSTDSYPFMVILNVAFFAIAGFVGLAFLRKAVRAVFSPASVHVDPRPPAPEPVPNATAPSISPIPVSRPLPPRVDPGKRIFTVWTIIYAVVGAQMGWILRPFIGSPEQAFELFRTRESNFFQAVLNTLERLFF